MIQRAEVCVGAGFKPGGRVPLPIFPLPGREWGANGTRNRGRVERCSAAAPAAVVKASRLHKRGQDALLTAGRMPALHTLTPALSLREGEGAYRQRRRAAKTTVKEEYCEQSPQ